MYLQTLIILLMVAVAYWGIGGPCMVPVFGALLFGCTTSAGSNWRFSPFSLILGIFASALVGVAVAHFVPNVYLRFFMAFVLVAILSWILKAYLPPLFSVALQPVFVSSDRWTYVAVLTFYAVLLVLLQWAQMKRGRLVRHEAADVSLKMTTLRYGLIAVAFVPLALVARHMANGCFLLPCLFFAMVEWCSADEECVSHSITDFTQMALAALLGVLADGWAMDYIANHSLPDVGPHPAMAYALSCLPTLGLLLFVSKAYGRLFLPSVAVLLFPFLRDYQVGYVLAVNFASIYLLLCAKGIRRLYVG